MARTSLTWWAQAGFHFGDAAGLAANSCRRHAIIWVAVNLALQSQHA